MINQYAVSDPSNFSSLEIVPYQLTTERYDQAVNGGYEIDIEILSGMGYESIIAYGFDTLESATAWLTNYKAEFNAASLRGYAVVNP